LCGDGTVSNPFLINGKAVNMQNIAEQCDNGSDNGIAGNPCSAVCQIVLPNFCGNGALDLGEECDDGPLNSNTIPDTCRQTCTNARCGDGVIDSAEQCDDSNSQDGDGCSAQCISELAAPSTAVAQIIDLPFLPAFSGTGTGANAGVSTNITAIATSHAPVGDAGPGALIAIVTGAAAGFAAMRKRKVKS